MIKKLNVKEAIEIIAEAWNNVKLITIKNCWQHTGILPEDATHSITDAMEIDEIDECIDRLTVALNRLKLVDSSVDMTVEEYVELDNDLISANVPTEEEILEELLVAEGVSQQTLVQIEEDSNNEEEVSISVQAGRQALETAKKFLEQREFTTESDMKYMRSLIRRLDESVEKLKRQTSLTEYLNQ